MPQPRLQYQFFRQGALDLSYPVDGTIVPPALAINGYSPAVSAQTGYAVANVGSGVGTPTAGLGSAGQRVLGKVMAVHPDGTTTVQVRGYCYLPYTAGGDAPVVGESVVVNGAGGVQRASGGASTAQVWTLTAGGSTSSGTFTLTLLGQTTAPIAYNATGATVAAALNLLAGIGAAGIVGSGSAGGPITLTAANQLAGQNLPNLTVDNTLMVGGTYGSAITTTGAPALYVPNNTRCDQVGITDPFPPANTAAGTVALIWLG